MLTCCTTLNALCNLFILTTALWGRQLRIRMALQALRCYITRPCHLASKRQCSHSNSASLSKAYDAPITPLSQSTSCPLLTFLKITFHFMQNCEPSSFLRSSVWYKIMTLKLCQTIRGEKFKWIGGKRAWKEKWLQKGKQENQRLLFCRYGQLLHVSITVTQPATVACLDPDLRPLWLLELCWKALLLHPDFLGEKWKLYVFLLGCLCFPLNMHLNTCIPVSAIACLIPIPYVLSTDQEMGGYTWRGLRGILSSEGSFTTELTSDASVS